VNKLLGRCFSSDFGFSSSSFSYVIQERKVYKYLHVHTIMAREIKAIKGGKVEIRDNVEEIYEKRITPYGNGAKVDAPKRHIGKRVFIIVLKK